MRRRRTRKRLSRTSARRFLVRHSIPPVSSSLLECSFPEFAFTGDFYGFYGDIVQKDYREKVLCFNQTAQPSARCCCCSSARPLIHCCVQEPQELLKPMFDFVKKQLEVS